MVEYLLPSGVSKSAEQAAGGAEESLAEPTDDAIDQIIVKLALREGLCGVELNGSRLPEFDVLLTRLKAIGKIKSDVPVIIDPNGDVGAESAIKAYDFARQAGFLRVYFATRNPA
ncbi:MAG: hypothetical protein Aurels2KO_27410 [Aureliella sp.]